MTVFELATKIQNERYSTLAKKPTLLQTLKAERSNLEQSWMTRRPMSGYDVAYKLKRLDKRIKGLESYETAR